MSIKQAAVDFIQQVMGDQQIKDSDLSQVGVLLLDDNNFKAFSQQDKLYLQKFTELQHLSLNTCHLTSLKNFPKLPNLLKLELNDNKFPPSQLGEISKLVNLKNLKLAGSKISTFKDLQPIKELKLMSIDLEQAPVCKVQGFVDKMFDMFPDLESLNLKDKDGNQLISDDEDDEDDDDDGDFELKDEDLEEIDEETLKKMLQSGELQVLDDVDDDDEDDDEEEDDEDVKNKDNGKEHAEVNEIKNPSKKAKH